MSLLDAARERLDVRLAQEQAQERLPSLAAALVRDGEVVWSGAAGTIDGRAGGVAAGPDTAYRIGSITKSMVAVGVMRLVAEGALAPTDPIRAHLPELDSSLDPVTVAALLGHSAGVVAETQGPWWERSPGLDWAELLPSVRLVHQPGRRFHYSNVGFAVLGHLLEQHRGRPWQDALADEVFAPLGMTRTGYHPSAPSAPGLAVHPDLPLRHVEPEQDTGAMAPAGQLWSTATDLARWATFVAAGDRRVLPTGLLRDMQVPGVVWDTPGQPWVRCYGWGFDVLNVEGRRFVGHGGSMPGFTAVVLSDPDTGVGVTTLSNSTAGPSGGLGRELVDLLEQHAPAAPPPWRTRPTDHADLAGTWYWGPRPQQLAVTSDGTLTLGPPGGGGRWSTFVPAGTDTFVGGDDYWAGETLRVLDRGTDRVRLDLGSFRLTRRPYQPDADIPGGVDEQGWHA